MLINLQTYNDTLYFDLTHVNIQAKLIKVTEGAVQCIQQ